MTIILEPLASSTDVTWHPVCALADLEPEWGEAALIDGQQFALYRLWDDSVRAVSNQDPTTGSFVMARGIVGTRSGRPTIASPLHKQVYDLESGECLSHPGSAISVFDTRITDGVIEIQLPAAA